MVGCVPVPNARPGSNSSTRAAGSSTDWPPGQIHNLRPKRIGLKSRRDTPAGSLTYAEQRALEIGITIAGGSKVVLLDEPTAGMSRSETTRAVELIRRVTESRTLVMVEHDMSVVFDLADRISVVVYGEVIATDTPEAIRNNAAVQEAYLGTAVSGH